MYFAVFAAYDERYCLKKMKVLPNSERDIIMHPSIEQVIH